VNYKLGDWAKQLKQLLQKQPSSGVDIILDCVGADYFAQNLDVLNTDGRLVMIGNLGGTVIQSQPGLDISLILRKRLKIEGSTLRTRSVQYKTELVSQFTALTYSLLSTGDVHPVIHRIYDWKDVAKAHEEMELNQNIGKIVLTLEKE